MGPCCGDSQTIIAQSSEIDAAGSSVQQPLSRPADGRAGRATERNGLARVPDLTKALREASPDVQRQVFEAFELQIVYDKADRRIAISATVSDAARLLVKPAQFIRDVRGQVAVARVGVEGVEQLRGTIADPIAVRRSFLKTTLGGRPG
jgi:hypothetical protein